MRLLKQVSTSGSALAVSVALLLLISWTEAQGTEAPCHYPGCFPASEVTRSFRYRLDETKLRIHTLGKLDQVEMVLVEVSTPGYAESGKLVEGFVVRQANSDKLEFERFTRKGSFPKITFAAPLDQMPTLHVQLADGGGVLEISPEKSHTTRADSKYIMSKYREQQTEEDLSRELDAARQEVGLAVDKINSACGSKATWKVTTGKFNFRTLAEKADLGELKYRCAELLSPLADVICSNPDGKHGVQKVLRVVECHYSQSGKSSMSLRNGVLLVDTSLTAPRDGKGSFSPLPFFEQKLGHTSGTSRK